jgi:hypothetical protein
MEHGFKPGDVVRYNPAQHHCREGIAIAYERGNKVVLLDTFWGGYDDRHMPHADELADAELQFNINDYDELAEYSHSSRGQWEKYAPDDREVITSQHGLQRRYFVRKGACEHWPTQIDNARSKLEECESEAASAQRSVEYAQEFLARVIAEAEAAQAGRL